MNLYQKLGVGPDATDAEIKSAYRKLAKQFHPDRNPESAEKFADITQAYNILKDGVKRLNYDRTGTTDPTPSLEDRADNMLAEMWLQMLEFHHYEKKNYFDLVYVEVDKIKSQLMGRIKELGKMIAGVEYLIDNSNTEEGFRFVVTARLQEYKDERASLEQQQQLFDCAKDRVLKFSYNGEVTPPNPQQRRPSARGMNGYWS